VTGSDAPRLNFGFDFADLVARDGLIRLDQRFLRDLAEQDAPLHQRLLAARAAPEDVTSRDESDLVVALGPYLDSFVATLFGIEAETNTLTRETLALDPIHACKRLFVQRQAVKKYADPSGFDGSALRTALETLIGEPLTERNFATSVTAWENDPEALDEALRYAAWATLTPAGQADHRGGTLFRIPHRVDPQHLVPVETIERDGVTMLRLPEHDWRHREGFALTDHGMNTQQALDQVNYCIWCHTQGKDSCSTGLKDRKTGAFQKSPFGVTLAGCPLDEKISEMHTLRAAGHVLGAFATIAIDNPMMAATGHRICNDCMKACIYQKQDAVDIPQAETSILKDVLALPWGFEIYALLTRWNPLDIRRPLPRSDSGRKVLIVGLGPAGFTLAHHLMNDGHTIIAVDGLKIEPLNFDVTAPIRDVETIFENLDDRVMAGFGGVAEYGITVRWNKNYLKLVRLLLERRVNQFAHFGGIRFGGGATLSMDDAWAMGFDHIALCMGAGKPTVLDIPNGLARGVRQAFLMALQLTGAAKQSSIANLQLRLPVVVIGGGLTAIDTATESLAYYVRQVEKFALRYRILTADKGENAVRARWTPEEAETADEFLAHAAAIRAERDAAAAENRTPALAPLLDRWGGATIAYRRRLVDSPSYTLNHEEVAKALEEAVRFAEGLTPVAVETDSFGHAAGLRVKRADGSEATLPARAILVAAGTQPNTVLAREDHRIELDGRYFQAIDENGAKVEPVRGLAKPDQAHVLMHRAENGRFISFFGDLHPSFFGNVVKAMGGAKRGYPVVSRALAAQPATSVTGPALIAAARDSLTATVHAVHRLTPTIIEVVIRAPAAARAFRPGQFYRLQNFEVLAAYDDEPGIGRTLLNMEGLAMTGAWTDPKAGLVSVIVLEMGGSSDLCAMLRPGEPVILMGPTGCPTEIHAGGTVALVGGGLGNAVLFSIGAATRAAGSKVIYFAGYKAIRDRYKLSDIERAADVIVWCCDEAPGFAPNPERPQDRTFVGNIVQAMAAYGSGALGQQAVPLADADHMIVIGSDRMMQAVGAARHGVLAPYLKPGHGAIGSINSPMQCMMKEVCAQCLQPRIDPETGERTVVFSCFNQDQALDRVDFPALHERLGQNGTQEKLTAQWIDRTLRRLTMRVDVAAE
jgi:NADPH-dependent glutamate synthase beta subunit-like oxidoreductase/NAD(P)H-flavin reductase